jgi:hypothetical protein
MTEKQAIFIPIMNFFKFFLLQEPHHGYFPLNRNRKNLVRIRRVNS